MALEILTKSFKNISNLKTSNYTLIFVDSMFNGKSIKHNKTDTAYVNINSTSNTLYLFPNGNANYVTKDTLFSLKQKPYRTVTASNNWDSHKYLKYNICNIFKQTEKFPDQSIDSIRFNNLSGKNRSASFVIEIVYKKREWNNGTVKSVLEYDRIWIDKETLLPKKKRRYSHRTDDLNTNSIDIYEYNILFTKNNPSSHFSLKVFKDPKYRHASLAGKQEDVNNMMGNNAVNFMARDINSGNIRQLSDFSGKVIILDFWYLACPPCRTLMPVLERINQKYKNSNFIILGVNIKDKDNEKIKKYVNGRFTYLQLYNSADIEKTYKLSSYPTTLLIDKSGKIKQIEVGYSDDFETRISKMIDYELTK